MIKVNEAAKIAGVSVRTLHYYDKIGLLKPSQIGENGYRFYGEADFARLQQILFFKELDFSLEDIKAILDNPGFDRRSALESHMELLVEKKRRIERIIASVEQTIQSIRGGTTMSKQEMFEPFDMKKIEEHQKKYEQEVKEKYGGTKAYEESQRRTSGYTKEDWQRISEQVGAIYRRIAAAMPKGPADEEAQEAIGQWHKHITDSYYECTTEIFRGLGDMYVADSRFTANIDKYGEGLAAFMRDAMHIYCDRLERA
ncbi:MerR family transcriptional regulator [Paenibacillus sp. NEAU-GSW1]|uniref:MerR family transcriptional regulator n=1 Tax=Paenibacillus sp. NEAU-GSW1 TaxID=2682486 RepID=UPI0012E2C71F|nr:MerR family transcriptional regulator [Paenibacillus sp. NEAU-GSW1]MUT65283.1 MerR family transcriptional regulator [Paenibacillus sp. NEAU-GSW1]